MTALPPQNRDRHTRSCHLDKPDIQKCQDKFSCALETLTKRSDFLAAARAKKWITPAFIVQAAKRDILPDGIRFGLTASRKVGNAVCRNRAKRRLRALAREILPHYCETGYDIVLIARRQDKELSFDDLRRDLKWALKRLNVKREGAK